MKNIYELARGCGDGKFYIRGLLKYGGVLDNHKWQSQDPLDGSLTFEGGSVTPEYLGLCQVSRSVDTRAIQELLSRCLHRTVPNIAELVKISSNDDARDIRFSKRINAYAIDTGSVALSIPDWHPDKTEYFLHNVLLFNVARIPKK